VLDGLSDLKIRSRADTVTAADFIEGTRLGEVSESQDRRGAHAMQSAIFFLEQHRIVVSALGIALVLIGGVLTRARMSVSLSAKSGGVIVVGDNSGSISTGTAGNSMVDKAIAITGVMVAVIGAAVAILAWWYPKTPS
jgi:hypothetical protein